jgi:hypothetical protein
MSEAIPSDRERGVRHNRRSAGSSGQLSIHVGRFATFDAAEEFRGYRGTCTDVTAIMRAQRTENELRETEAKLARATQAATVAELSASIAH